MQGARVVCRRVWTILLAAFATMMVPTASKAQTVTAAWDPSPLLDLVTGYQVCIGTTSFSCNLHSASLGGNVTSYTFSPAAGTLTYVAVRAVNLLGVSPYSSEVKFSIPEFLQPPTQTSAVGGAIAPLSLSVSDPDASGVTFTHTGLPPGLGLNASSGQITGTPSSPGAYEVTVYANDGLVTVPRSWTWVITTNTGGTPDREAPSLNITSHSPGQAIGSLNATISGTASDSGTGNSGIVAVRVNGQAASGGLVSGSGTANWSRSVVLTSGANTVTVEAIDGAGNVSLRQFTLQAGSSSSSGSSPNSPSEGNNSLALTSTLPSPQAPGTSITFTAWPSSGIAAPQYKWWIYDGTAWFLVHDWSASAKYTWTPTDANSAYRVGVWVKSGSVNGDAREAEETMAFPISATVVPSGGSSGGSSGAPTTLTITSLTSDLPSPQSTGTTVTFTATVAGGSVPHEYKWWIYDGTAWSMVRDWSTSPTYTWLPTQASSTYLIGVWVKSAGVMGDAREAEATMAFPISSTGGLSGVSSGASSGTLSELTITSLTSDLPSPQSVWTPLAFTATAAGGTGLYEYKWFIYDGNWFAVQDWSPSPTFTWTPTVANAGYRIGLWVRNAGGAGDHRDAELTIDFAITW